MLPWLGLEIAAIEQLQAVLLVGSNLRKEQPILGHRLRKAALDGAAVSFITPIELDLNYPAEQQVGSPLDMVNSLAAVAKALGVKGKGDLAGLIKKRQGQRFQQGHRKGHSKKRRAAAVMLGNLAVAHPDFAVLCGLAELVAQAAGPA